MISVFRKKVKDLSAYSALIFKFPVELMHRSAKPV